VKRLARRHVVGEVVPEHHEAVELGARLLLEGSLEREGLVPVQNQVDDVRAIVRFGNRTGVPISRSIANAGGLVTSCFR
jgi:hypothetical protein